MGKSATDLIHLTTRGLGPTIDAILDLSCDIENLRMEPE